MVPSNGLWGRYFCPRQSAKSWVTLSRVLRLEPITKRILHFVMNWVIQIGWICCTVLQFEFIACPLSCCVAISFIFVVGLQFLLYVLLLRISLYIYIYTHTRTHIYTMSHYIYVHIYIHILVCFMQRRKTTMQHGCVFACVSNVNTFCYAYHFICKCCVFHMYITTASFPVFNGRQFPMMLRHRMHVAAQGRERET